MYHLAPSLLKRIFNSIEPFPDSDCRNRVRSILKREEHKKLVIMLIDAWQKSFFNETSMPFLAKLSSLGNAKIFEANVQPPTVTMPRIKVCV